jgi:hypothetical protein
MPTHRRLYVINPSTTPMYVAVEAPYEAAFLGVCQHRHPNMEFVKSLHELEELGIPQLNPATVDLWLPMEWDKFIEYIDIDQPPRELARQEAEKVRQAAAPALEIQKVLVVSGVHINLPTVGLLRRGLEARNRPSLVNPSKLIVDSIGEYGWRVCVEDFSVEAFFAQPKGVTGSPFQVLSTLIKFARLHQCNWLAIDRDGPVVEGLTKYNW